MEQRPPNQILTAEIFEEEVRNAIEPVKFQLALCMKVFHPQITKAGLNKKRKLGGVTINCLDCPPDVKTYYTATQIQ